MSDAGVIIVGSGQGGFQVAASLRDEDYAGPIALIGDEPGLPYQRPPLSKAFLLGKVRPEQIELRPAAYYIEKNIEVISSQQVTKIDREARRITLASGALKSYEQLVLATGARARIPKISGINFTGVARLRTLSDAQVLISVMQPGRRVVIVGAGFIGMEVAVNALELGLDVHLLETTDRALKRTLTAISGNFLTYALIQRGAKFSFNTRVIGFTGVGGRVTGTTTNHGETIPSDMVVIGIGVEPNVELALEAGLHVHDGIVVNDRLITSDPRISAIGDCARFHASYSDALVRLESVQNSVDQARCVAAQITGKGKPYNKVPWFWSDQGTNRLQIAGVAQADDIAVLRGDINKFKFSVFRFRADRITAVESINSVGDHMLSRKLLANPANISPEQAADKSLDLAALAVSP